MITRFDFAYYAAAPLAVPLLAWRWAKRGKYRESTAGMLGLRLPASGSETASRFGRGSVWIHAVSVGEVAAAKAVEPGLRALFPELPFVVSTVTETGQAAARRSIPGAEAFSYLPADLSWNVSRFLDVFRPRVIAIMETELWPNFITLAAARGTRVFLVNGKLSDRSFPRYRMAARGPLRPVFQSISGVCAQTAEDAGRFSELGIPADRIRATGNCKFDLQIDPLGAEERSGWRARLGLSPDQPVILAGSTHPGEEEVIVRAFREVRARMSGCALILVPRHPERFDAVHRWLADEKGLRVRRSSLAEGPSEPEVVLMDQMGVLTRAYGLADVAIVAGSFCPVGGHNIMEPAAHGVPVVYGPDMHSQREMAQLFKNAGAGRQVGPDALAATLAELLADPALRRDEGALVRSILAANQGSSARVAAMIGEWAREP